MFHHEGNIPELVEHSGYAIAGLLAGLAVGKNWLSEKIRNIKEKASEKLAPATEGKEG